jgi:RNA polymerase sigma factor (TIGR02999 family)
MRQVLIDHARGAGAAKRWGGQQRVPLEATVEFAGEGFGQLQVIEVDRALQALAREDSSLAQIIEMHYFGGMTAEEVAAVVDRSSEAVRHDIRLARAWLRRYGRAIVKGGEVQVSTSAGLLSSPSALTTVILMM